MIFCFLAEKDLSFSYFYLIQILCIEGSNVLKAGAVVYNGGTAGNKYSDMSCFDTGVEVEIGCIKVFFVNKFISDLLVR